MNYTQRDIDVFNHAVNWLTGVGQQYLEQYPRAQGKSVVNVQVEAVTKLSLFARANGFKLPTDNPPPPVWQQVVIAALIGGALFAILCVAVM